MDPVVMDERGIGYIRGDSWVEIDRYNSTQNQNPMYEQIGFAFIQPHILPSIPSEPSFHVQMAQQPHTTHQQLLPLIMPSHPAWHSMLTNPAGYSSQPVPIPPASSAPTLTKGSAPKLPAIHATPSLRKTLTDADRRRMCKYHEENPTVKQTEIGLMMLTLLQTQR
jgi:hypothetical protein